MLRNIRAAMAKTEIKELKHLSLTSSAVSKQNISKLKTKEDSNTLRLSRFLVLESLFIERERIRFIYLLVD